MVARVNSVAFQGIEVLDVDVQVQMTSGLPAFSVVGLPDKAVAESREGARGALHAMGRALPSKRITVNLAPVHVLVIPKGAYESMDDFSANAGEAEIAGFFRAVGTVARDFGVVEDGYRFLANNGADAHQEVPHFHIHIFAGRDLGGMIKRA